MNPVGNRSVPVLRTAPVGFIGVYATYEFVAAQATELVPNVRNVSTSAKRTLR